MIGNLPTTAMGSIHRETLRNPLAGLRPKVVYISIYRLDTGLSAVVNDGRVH